MPDVLFATNTDEVAIPYSSVIALEEFVPVSAKTILAPLRGAVKVMVLP
jgi:hypothetical protein